MNQIPHPPKYLCRVELLRDGNMYVSQFSTIPYDDYINLILSRVTFLYSWDFKPKPIRLTDTHLLNNNTLQTGNHYHHSNSIIQGCKHSQPRGQYWV
jgi:hypothetical protein